MMKMMIQRPIFSFYWRHFTAKVAQGNLKQTRKHFNTKVLFSPAVFLVAKHAFFSLGVTMTSFGLRGAYEYFQTRNKCNYLFKLNDYKFRLKSKAEETYSLTIERDTTDWRAHSKINCPIYRVGVGITFVNSLVTLAWQAPEAKEFMFKYFATSISPDYRRTLTSTVLSTFSHISFREWFISSNTLLAICHDWSSGNNQLIYFGKDRSGVDDFLALYVSSAVCSNFLAFLYKNIMNQNYPSFGAVGALMSLLGYMLNKSPNKTITQDNDVQLSFLQLFIALVTLCLVGLLLTVLNFPVFFDSATALGGLIFGCWYAQSGEALMMKFSSNVVEFLKEGEKQILQAKCQ